MDAMKRDTLLNGLNENREDASVCCSLHGPLTLLREIPQLFREHGEHGTYGTGGQGDDPFPEYWEGCAKEAEKQLEKLEDSDENACTLHLDLEHLPELEAALVIAQARPELELAATAVVTYSNSGETVAYAWFSPSGCDSLKPVELMDASVPYVSREMLHFDSLSGEYHVELDRVEGADPMLLVNLACEEELIPLFWRSPEGRWFCRDILESLTAASEDNALQELSGGAYTPEEFARYGPWDYAVDEVPVDFIAGVFRYILPKAVITVQRGEDDDAYVDSAGNEYFFLYQMGSGDEMICDWGFPEEVYRWVKLAEPQGEVLDEDEEDW